MPGERKYGNVERDTSKATMLKEINVFALNNVRDKEIQERMEMHGRKRHRDVKRSMLEEESGMGMLNRISGRKVRGNERRKGSTGMWNETQEKQQSLAGK